MALGIIEPRTSITTNLPGTELLVDNKYNGTGQRNFKHGEGKKTDIILVPQPSEDPNDPLLWSRWKREAAFGFLFFNCIVFAACPGTMIAPATMALAAELDVPVKKISELSGYQLLVVGALGPLDSVFARKYGKRPQFLAACFFGIVGTGICIAGFDQSSLSRSYDVLLTGRIIQGIGTTAFESLSIAALGDMFFLHERGLRTALLVLTLACLSSFVAIIAGTGFEHLGARNLFVMLLPIQIFGGLGALFCVPESQFRRNRAGEMGLEILEAAKMREKSRLEVTDGIRLTTASSTGGEKGIAPFSPKRTFVQDLRVMSGTYSEAGFLKLLGEVFVHLANPAVIWVMIVSAVLVSLFVATAYTLAQIFTPPPYGLTVSQNGYFYTGALVGGLLSVSAGPICDFSAKYFARRNNGVYEAEFRIPVCLLAVIVFSIGWFTFGWAVDNPKDGGIGRIVLCSFCYGAVCLGTSVASISGGLYILDAFRAYSTEIFILQMMIKNFLFYAFSLSINHFVAEKGPGHMCRVFGIATLAGFTTCIPMYVFGKLNRAWMHKLWKMCYAGEA